MSTVTRKRWRGGLSSAVELGPIRDQLMRPALMGQIYDGWTRSSLGVLLRGFRGQIFVAFGGFFVGLSARILPCLPRL